jgi:hypothetical protein
MRDPAPRTLRAILLIVALEGCSGASVAPSPPPDATNATTRNPQLHSADKAVGGVINSDNWNVPKGTTMTVEARGLTVFAKRNIAIDGTLIIAPGTKVAFFGKSFSIDGRIEPSLGSSGSVRTARKPVNDVISACAIRVGNLSDSPGYAQLIFPAGDNLFISANAASNCQLETYTGMALDNGRSGNLALAGSRDGENGGNLEIGTPAAIAMTKRAAREAQKVVQAYAAGYVLVVFRIFGAPGGPGATDNTGAFSANSWLFKPSSGGRGGNVVIQTKVADTSALSGALITGGNGGDAGAAYPSVPLDGTVDQPNAANLSLVQGSGGDGGSVSIKAETIASAIFTQGGNGGAPSGVSAVGGNGYGNDVPNGPIGQGGSIALSLGKAGKAGKGNVNGTDGSFAAMNFSGGAGGTPACCFAGGLGGTFTVTRPPNIPPLPTGVTITLDAFGTGGFGASGCGTPAFPGGNGGNLNDLGKENVSLVDGSFDGGDGGSGTPPAAGGQGGKNVDLGTQIGSNGASGSSC